MTTIAANTSTMACDSKITLGDISFISFKIIRMKGALIGTAGDAGPGNKFMEWYGTRKKRPALTPSETFEALVLAPNGLFWYGEDFQPVPVVDGVMAIGSGAASALTAMRVYKASPREAVEAACLVDNNTRGPVIVHHLRGKR